MGCTTALAVMTSRCLADLDLVAEPVALELRQKGENIYLHAQIFTGFMYIAAGVCMWLLRVWKIEQIEQIAAEQEKRSEDIPAASAEPVDDGTNFPKEKRSRGASLKGVLMWKKV